MSSTAGEALTPLLSQILLIDDDAISREVMAMMLEMHGIAIDTAEDGAAALALLDAAIGSRETDPLDWRMTLPLVILMDTQMPGLSGLALVEALRQRSRARILAISGSEVSLEIRQATDGFLLKPIEIESLIQLLEAQPGEMRGMSGIEIKASEESAVAPNGPDGAMREPILDPLILRKFKAMMTPSAVREIYVAVAGDLHPRLEKLEAAIKDGDPEEVRRIAHAIKGGCAMVGLTKATEAAARLESSGGVSNERSNGQPAYLQELDELRFTLGGLEGILGDDFPQ